MEKIRFNHLFFGLFFSFALVSCKSEYERIRTSGDPVKILEAAQKYYEEEEYQRAQSLFELIIASYRGRQEAEDISYKYAYTYYHTRNFLLAAYYFKNFSQTYSTSPLREEAVFMSAYSNYKVSPKFRLDQTATNTAISELQLFINTFPTSPRVAQCNELIDELRAKLEMKAFDEGMLYFKLRRYTASIQVFENLLKDFPETDDTELIRYQIILSGFLLAENSILQRQEEPYQEVIDLAAEYEKRFTESEYLDEVQKMREDSQQAIKNLENVRYQNQSTGS
jgi:outer membrane protein assembly factor BamD